MFFCARLQMSNLKQQRCCFKLLKGLGAVAVCARGVRCRGVQVAAAATTRRLGGLVVVLVELQTSNL